MKNDRPLTPGQKKKALAATTSMLGNIKTYFPNMGEDFLASLSEHYPELFTLAVESGVIKKVDSTLSGKPAPLIAGEVERSIHRALCGLG